MRVRLNPKRLQEVLARKTISQNHWAIKLGLSKGHLSNLLAGRHPYPSAHTRERLLEITGATFDELFQIENAADLPDAGVQQVLRDRYLVDKAIGQGGMGTVYLARDVRMHRMVAVKIVSPEAVSDVGSKALFNEIVRTSQLQHPHILPVFDAGEADGSPFVVTPYERGGSLRDRMRTRGKLSTDDALAILGGVAAALDYAHRQGVLHCDVKPANVLLTENHAYLIDFGIARFIRSEVWSDLERGAEVDSGAGTPAYVSPEQARGERALDARSDVYSLACLMFEMLTGRPPFEGPTTLATVARRLIEPPPRLTEFEYALPEALERALARGMALNREERTPTAVALYKECAEALRTGAPVRAVPEHTGEYPTTRDGRLAGWLQDVRWAARSLRRAPLFSAMAALVLALGVGATTSMFSVVNAVLLRPLPYPEPSRLVALTMVYHPGSAAEQPSPTIEYDKLPDLRRAGHAFIALGVFAQTQLPVRVGDRALLPVMALVDSGFMPALGVKPLLGGLFPRGPDLRTVLVSHRFWLDALDGDPAAVGRTIFVNGAPYAVAGVLPTGFRVPREDAAYFREPEDVLIPAESMTFGLSGFPWYGVGRLAPGVTIAQARDELASAARGLSAQGPADGTWSVRVARLDEETERGARPSLLIALGIAVLLLLVAITNVMNLLFSRGAARLREMAIHQAMGCTPRRALRQTLLEAGLLGGLGALGGIALAVLATGTLMQWSPVNLPVTGRVGVDGRVLVFTVVLALAAALGAGFFPAWYARARSDEALRSPGLRVAGDRGLLALQRVLCVAQMALGFGLLGGAGVLTHSLLRLNAVDPGFRTDHVLGFSLTVPGDRTGAERQRFFLAAVDAVRGIPGVIAAGWITIMPPEPKQAMFMPIAVQGTGTGPPLGAPIRANHQVTSPGYFEAVGMEIVEGRAFDAGDGGQSAPVAVVNQTLARHFFAGRDALGGVVATVFDGSTPVRRIVGVVSDTHDRGLGRDAIPTIYIPLGQFSVPFGSIVAHTRVPPLSIAPEVRRRLAALDPSVPVVGFQTLDDRVRDSLQEPRFYTLIAGVCAGMAVLFVALGLYGIVAFAVSRRRAEFGVRVAIGAAPGSILRLVLRDGLVLALLGLVIGLPLAVALSRVLRSMLFQVGVLDPLTLGGAASVVILVTLSASFLPALRATRVSPVTALRAD